MAMGRSRRSNFAYDFAELSAHFTFPLPLSRRRVLGIDASAKLDETRAQVEKIARNTAELIGLGRDLRDDEITVLPGWAGDFYGIPVRSTLDAIRLTGRLEGMIIDPVY